MVGKPRSYSKYLEGGQCHEAAFDAYMTGVVFASVAREDCDANKLFLMRCDCTRKRMLCMPCVAYACSGVTHAAAILCVHSHVYNLPYG